MGKGHPPSFQKSNHGVLKVTGWAAWNLTTNLSVNKRPLRGGPIYPLHISINNHGRMQLVPWNGCGSHMTDQLSRGGAAIGVIHSLSPAQSDSTPSIFSQGWKYASVTRPPLLRLPVTPGAAHNQPGTKRQSVAVSRKSSVDWKSHQLPPISLTLISRECGYFSGSLPQCWVNDTRCCQAKSSHGRKRTPFPRNLYDD